MAFTVNPVHSFGVSADGLRRMARHSGGSQPGVTSGTSFKVTQDAAPSLNMLVAAGGALVAPDTAGLYSVTSDASSSVTGAAGHATLPRIDCVVLKVLDSVALGTTNSDGVTPLVKLGTPTAGATLDNRNGAPTLAAGELLLSDALMGAAGTTYITGNIRDRRPWANGFSTIIAGDGSGNLSTTATSLANVPAHSTPRIEVTAGNAVEITGTSPTGGSGRLTVLVGGTTTADGLVMGGGAAITDQLTTVSGSQLVVPRWAASTGTFTIANSGVYLTRILVREIVGGQRANT